jgi:hypothetical protein
MAAPQSTRLDEKNRAFGANFVQQSIRYQKFWVDEQPVASKRRQGLIR